MASLFDEVRAIVLNRGTRAAKIDKMVNDLKITRYEAQTFYAQLAPEMGLTMPRPAAAATPRGARRFTIGVEIECYGIDRERVRAAIEARGLKACVTGYNHNDSKDTYKLGSDGSISGAGGCEVVSPVLRKLDSLETVCEVINEAGAQVNRSCGLHVHFGAKDFTDEQWRRIILNYAAIEGLIDGFMPESRRADNNSFCHTMRYAARSLRECWQIAGGLYTIRDFMSHIGSRYYKVNVMAFNTHKTIEFRQHSGTTDFEKIRAWVEFLGGLVGWSLDHEEILTAESVDDLPFITKRVKAFYKKRAKELKINNGSEICA